MFPRLNSRHGQALIYCVTILGFVFGNHPGCRAQSGALSAELKHRITSVLFDQSSLPAGATISFGAKSRSTQAGFDEVAVRYVTNGGGSGNIPILISKDEKTLAQYTAISLSDPRLKSNALVEGRPAIGGAEATSVSVVVFDDLQCPYCAKFNSELPHAITARYGERVRITYVPFPLSNHAWAMHAAIATECLKAQSPDAYWDGVNRLHEKANELGNSGKELQSIYDAIDLTVIQIVREHKLSEHSLSDCLARRDSSSIRRLVAESESLGIVATPTMLIDGIKIEGALPQEYIFSVIDESLIARETSKQITK